MPTCPSHGPFQGACNGCARDYFAILGTNGLVHVRPAGVLDDRDLPLPDGPTCVAMTHDSVGSERCCERARAHEGVCDDGTGLMWDHDEESGCCDGT